MGKWKIPFLAIFDEFWLRKLPQVIKSTRDSTKQKMPNQPFFYLSIYQIWVTKIMAFHEVDEWSAQRTLTAHELYIVLWFLCHGSMFKYYAITIPVNLVDINSALFVKGVSQFEQENKRVPPMCLRNILPIFCICQSFYKIKQNKKWYTRKWS